MLVDVQAPVCYNFGFSRTQMMGNSAPPSPPPNLIKFINCATFPENNTGKCISHFPPSRNSTQKQYLQRDCVTFHEKQKLFIFFFFPGRHFQKVINLFVILFSCSLTAISSTFVIIFADCHGLSCVHVRASSYTALFRVSLGGVGLRCVGLAQKISARCNTGSYVFSFFFICIFILFLALLHIFIFLFPQRVPSDF